MNRTTSCAKRFCEWHNARTLRKTAVMMRIRAFLLITQCEFCTESVEKCAKRFRVFADAGCEIRDARSAPTFFAAAHLASRIAHRISSRICYLFHV